MDSHEAPQKFPESEVDKLVADFGRKPSQETLDQVEDIIKEQRPKYEALNRAVQNANDQKQDRSKGRRR